MFTTVFTQMQKERPLLYLTCVFAAETEIETLRSRFEQQGETLPLSVAYALVQQDQVSVRRASGGAARLLQQHEPYEAHHLGLRMVTPNEPTQELSIGEQRCSTPRLQTRGATLGMLGASHAPVRWKFSRRLTSTSVLTRALFGRLPVFLVPTGTMVVVDYNIQWNLRANRKL
jgi:hypothetical protein